jgi:hypothetical protein
MKDALYKTFVPRFWRLLNNPLLFVKPETATLSILCWEATAFNVLRPLPESKWGLLESEGGEPQSAVIYSCTCSDYYFRRSCAHALGFALFKNEIYIPEDGNPALVSGQKKRSAGQPEKNKGGDALKRSKDDKNGSD